MVRSQPFERSSRWRTMTRKARWPQSAGLRRAECLFFVNSLDIAKQFREAIGRGEELGLSDDELRFYDALATNESAVRELTVDWSKRESVRASLRFMVKRILRKYKYPPDMAETAIELVLQQAEKLGEDWNPL